MSTKAEALRSGTSCLSRALPDEPIFIIRAKDVLAPQMLRLWATMAVGTHEGEKIDEALRLADDMADWRNRNVCEDVPVYPSKPAPYESQATDRRFAQDIKPYDGPERRESPR